MHDAAHYRGYANRQLNDFVGEILALPTSASMAGYRNSHFAHHRELNSENDPDWQRNVGLKEYEFPAPPQQRADAHRAVSVRPEDRHGAVTGFHKNKETRDIAAAVARARLVLLCRASGFIDRAGLLEAASALLDRPADDGLPGHPLYPQRRRALRGGARERAERKPHRDGSVLGALADRSLGPELSSRASPVSRRALLPARRNFIGC